MIDDLTNPDIVWDGMARDIRNRIRKAEKSGIKVVDTDDLETFIDLNEKTFSRQGLPLPYSRDFVRRLDAACVERNARKIFITYGPTGSRIQAGIASMTTMPCTVCWAGATLN